MKFKTVMTYINKERGVSFKRVELDELLNEDMMSFLDFQEEIYNNCPFDLPPFNLHLTNYGNGKYEIEVHDGDFLNTKYEIEVKLDDVMEVGNRLYKLEVFD